MNDKLVFGAGVAISVVTLIIVLWPKPPYAVHGICTESKREFTLQPVVMPSANGGITTTLQWLPKTTCLKKVEQCWGRTEDAWVDMKFCKEYAQ